METHQRSKIAVVGGGITGMYAAHKLQDQFEVTLFESSDRLGGHELPIRVNVDGRDQEIDIGFLIFNPESYPLYTKYLKDLNIESFAKTIDMSVLFYNRSKRQRIYLSEKWKPLLSSLSFNSLYLLRFIKEFTRFQKKALHSLEVGVPHDITIAEFLSDFSFFFKVEIMKPYIQAIWCCPGGEALNLPAKVIIGFMKQHLLLGGEKRSIWNTLRPSTQIHIREFKKRFQGRILTETPVRKIHNLSNGTRVETALGAEDYDFTVMATHANLTHSILGNEFLREKQLLNVWNYSKSKVTLHTDQDVLPVQSQHWGAWNVDLEHPTGSITYNMNLIQNLPLRTSVFVTLGEVSIDPQKILYQCNMNHPIFSKTALDSQSEIQQLNQQADKLWLCGSYLGFGFHEDAIESASVAISKIMSLKQRVPPNEVVFR